MLMVLILQSSHTKAIYLVGKATFTFVFMYETSCGNTTCQLAENLKSDPSAKMKT